jgi:RNA polymerase sigma factor (sigma-70 family)
MTFEDAQFEFGYLISSYAHRYAGMTRDTYLDIDDLMQCGRIGLANAVRKQKKGKAFKSYARHLIRGAMLDEIRAAPFLPRPAYERGETFEMRHLDAEFGTENEHGDDASDLSELIGVSDELKPDFSWLIPLMEKVLTDDEFETLVGYYWNGMGLKGLAKLRGVTESAISIRLFRIRKKLRKAIEQEGYSKSEIL